MLIYLFKQIAESLVVRNMLETVYLISFDFIKSKKECYTFWAATKGMSTLSKDHIRECYSETCAVS